jgi:LmbE family N-acetylglucosaminyl deacetylase
MKSLLRPIVLLVLLSWTASLWAQEPQKVSGADERYKADILIVVAHPDDEAFFTPYAAKAMDDMHKRVAVIFSTHGGSGVNRFTRERGPAMAEEREIEARQACAKLGITNVWFLDGKDTASQDVLDSLSSWGHGVNLERLIGLMRLTRPEVVFTHIPGIFVGENHGDHQATGVLVTEAFDLAANPLVFPEQLAGPTKYYETYLSNLQTWQPKKIYYGSDASDSKQFEGSGPTYSVREVSPSKKKPYWRLAIDSAMTHRTQFPDDIDRLSKMSDAELEKMMSDPQTAWWDEPSTLIFGKSLVGGKSIDDVFAHLDENPAKPESQARASCADGLSAQTGEGKLPRLELGGGWAFYAKFFPAHGLCQLPKAKLPEIGIKTGAMLVVPLVIRHDPAKSATLKLMVKVPDGWKVTLGAGELVLPAEESTSVELHIDTPGLSGDELKKATPQEVRISAEADGNAAGEVNLKAVLRLSALPQ